MCFPEQAELKQRDKETDKVQEAINRDIPFFISIVTLPLLAIADAIVIVLATITKTIKFDPNIEVTNQQLHLFAYAYLIPNGVTSVISMVIVYLQIKIKIFKWLKK